MKNSPAPVLTIHPGKRVEVYLYFQYAFKRYVYLKQYTCSLQAYFQYVLCREHQGLLRLRPFCPLPASEKLFIAVEYRKSTLPP